MLTNRIKKVGKLISYGKKTHSFFFLEKMKEDDVGKNKEVTPRLAFPFFLKAVVKKGHFQKK